MTVGCLLGLYLRVSYPMLSILFTELCFSSKPIALWILSDSPVEFYACVILTKPYIVLGAYIKIHLYKMESICGMKLIKKKMWSPVYNVFKSIIKLGAYVSLPKC